MLCSARHVIATDDFSSSSSSSSSFLLVDVGLVLITAPVLLLSLFLLDLRPLRSQCGECRFRGLFAHRIRARRRAQEGAFADGRRDDRFRFCANVEKYE